MSILSIFIIAFMTRFAFSTSRSANISPRKLNRRLSEPSILNSVKGAWLVRSFTLSTILRLLLASDAANLRPQQQKPVPA